MARNSESCASSAAEKWNVEGGEGGWEEGNQERKEGTKKGTPRSRPAISEKPLKRDLAARESRPHGGEGPKSTTREARGSQPITESPSNREEMVLTPSKKGTSTYRGQKRGAAAIRGEDINKRNRLSTGLLRDKPSVYRSSNRVGRGPGRLI